MIEFLQCLLQEKQAKNVVLVVDNPAAHPSSSSLQERLQVNDAKSSHHWTNGCINRPIQYSKRRQPSTITQRSSPLHRSHAPPLIFSPAELQRPYEESDVPTSTPKQGQNIVLVDDTAVVHQFLWPQAQKVDDEADLRMIYRIEDSCISPWMMANTTKRYRQTRMARRPSPPPPSPPGSPTLSSSSSSSSLADLSEQEELELSNPVRLSHRTFDRWEGATSLVAKCDAPPLEPPRLSLYPHRWDSEVATPGSDAESGPRLPIRRNNHINRKITSVWISNLPDSSRKRISIIGQTFSFSETLTTSTTTTKRHFANERKTCFYIIILVCTHKPVMDQVLSSVLFPRMPFILDGNRKQI